MSGNLDRLFTSYSVSKLNQLGERIAHCLDLLSYEQVWRRGGDNENAIGNLVLHLCGNVRQWIGSGVAGKPDVRARDREFQARGGIEAAELKERLKGVLEDATAVIAGLDAERLAAKTRVQKYEVSVLEAVYQVVEHFAQHTGQILQATKMLTGEDLGFYKHLSPGAPSEHKQSTP